MRQKTLNSVTNPFRVGVVLVKKILRKSYRSDGGSLFFEESLQKKSNKTTPIENNILSPIN